MNNLETFTSNFKNIYKNKCMNTNLPSILPAVPRIIVIGDIHGDMDKLLQCLIIARLIKNKKWIGGDTVVVQVGDQIDSCYRGNGPPDQCNYIIKQDDYPSDIEILYFMTDLHNQATKFGGAVYSLVGNHEIMNVNGDMTYVSHTNLKMFKQHGTLEEGRQIRTELFSPGNEIANFLACTRQLAIVIGSNLFVHGGIIPYIANKYKIEDMNMILTLFLLGEIDKPEIFKDLFTNGKTSPLWTRVFGFKIDNCDKYMTPLKEIYNVNNIFVGHTPQIKKGISSRCDNRVWMTDVGMSRAFSNMSAQPQVLEIINDGEQFNILK